MSYSIAQEVSAKGDNYIKTWQLFLLIVLANLVLAWVQNNNILTREVYHNILSKQIESTRIDEYFDRIRDVTVWGYVLLPLLILSQIAILALLIQAPLLFMYIEIPFRQLSRIVTFGALAMTAADVVRVSWLFFMDSAEISSQTLKAVPLSIANFFEASDFPLSVYMLLGKFNVFEFIWCSIIYKGLIDSNKITKRTAAFLIIIIWTTLLLFQWGVDVYLNRINR
jgi:hypothetical protein